MGHFCLEGFQESGIPGRTECCRRWAERVDVGKARECSAAISGRATAKPTVAFGSGAVILWKHA